MSEIHVYLKKKKLSEILEQDEKTIKELDVSPDFDKFFIFLKKLIENLALMQENPFMSLNVIEEQKAKIKKICSTISRLESDRLQQISKN